MAHHRKHHRKHHHKHHHKESKKKNRIKFLPGVPRWIKYLTITLIVFFGFSYLTNLLGQKTPLTNYLSWFILILAIIILLKTLWYFLKKINRINLMSDLSLWLLKIFGAIGIFIGVYMLLFGGALSFLSNNKFDTYYVIIFGAYLIIIGIFCVFRGKRRGTILGIWR